MPRSIMIIASCCVLPLFGCSHQDATVMATPQNRGGATAQNAPVAQSSTYYNEVEYDGRIYVFGNEKTYNECKDKPHFSYRKVFVGGGPEGKTVVIEADQKDQALQECLIKEFSGRHKVNLD